MRRCCIGEKPTYITSGGLLLHNLLLKLLSGFRKAIGRQVVGRGGVPAWRLVARRRAQRRLGRRFGAGRKRIIGHGFRWGGGSYSAVVGRWGNVDRRGGRTAAAVAFCHFLRGHLRIFVENIRHSER